MTKALLSQQIDAVQFAMWELHLYLDTHPDDISALALFKKYEEKNEKRRALARKYLDDPTDMQNLNELFGLIRPLAVFVMKEHEKIPSLEKDDYMQIADITAWKVLERIRVKPDIIDNFEAYVVAAIRNGYIAEYRKYVFKSLLESKSYTRKNSSLNAAYLYSMEEYVEKIAEKLGIHDCFSFFSCPGFATHDSDKRSLIENAVEHFGADKKDVLMIGDTEFDINGANEAGVDSLGVLYGFAEDGTLQKCGATALADSPAEVYRVISEWKN